MCENIVKCQEDNVGTFRARQGISTHQLYFGDVLRPQPLFPSGIGAESWTQIVWWSKSLGQRNGYPNLRLCGSFGWIQWSKMIPCQRKGTLFFRCMAKLCKWKRIHWCWGCLLPPAFFVNLVLPLGKDARPALWLVVSAHWLLVMLWGVTALGAQVSVSFNKRRWKYSLVCSFLLSLFSFLSFLIFYMKSQKMVLP